MLSTKQILCEIEACVAQLKLCVDEERYCDMPYLLGRMSEYSDLIQEIVNAKLEENKWAFTNF